MRHQSDAALIDHVLHRNLYENGLIEDHIAFSASSEYPADVPPPLECRSRSLIVLLRRPALRSECKRNAARPPGRCWYCSWPASTALPNVADRIGLTDWSCLSVFSGMALISSTTRNLAVGIDVVVFRPDAHVAGGQNQIRFIDRAHHVHQLKLVSFQFDRIDINLICRYLPP